MWTYEQPLGSQVDEIDDQQYFCLRTLYFDFERMKISTGWQDQTGQP